jgi:hypothetical protein
MGDAKRDNNYITTLLAVSNSDGTTPVTLYADPVTHRLLVSAIGTSTDVRNEVPTGTVNGSNKDFVLANTPTAGSLQVYVNGQRFTVTEDFTLSGATITFVTAPPTTSKILCDYLY